jgi:hypothetical protein
MSPMGMTKPVYTISDNIKIAAGARAWTRERELAPMVLNTMERDKVMQKENSRKVKKAPGVLLRFVMKYKTTLNEMLLAILNGKSTIALAAASVKG